MNLNLIYFVHVLGSLTVGFYLLLPFVVATIRKMQPAAQAGFAAGLNRLNRIGQWLLIVQFLTGGYMISQFDLSVAWMVVVIVVFLLLGAVSGMLGAPLKRIIKAGTEGKSVEAKDTSRLLIFSTIAAVSVFILVLLMFFPDLI
jgi:hypothetical protein